MSGPERDKRKEQAFLIAKSLAATGLAAMNAGRLDLSEGRDFLLEAARSSDLFIVSANLGTADGKRLFPPSRTVAWGGKKAVIFGITRPEPAIDRALGLKVEDPAETAREVVKALKPDEIAICLTDLGYEGEHNLARAVPGIAFIVGGGDGVKSLSAPIPVRDSILLRASDRGRELGVLDLYGVGQGAWKTPANRARTEETRKQLENLKQAVSQAAPQSSLLVGGTVEALEKELDSQAPGSQGPEFVNRIMTLDSGIPDDPSTAARVMEFTSRHQKPAENKSPVPPPVRRTRLAPPSTTPPGFSVGAISCRRCHEKPYAKWLETGHSRSAATLPADKRNDPACLNCHGTALKLTRGRAFEPMVGCEACHGPGSAHPGKGIMKRKVDAEVCDGCHKNAHGKPPMNIADKYGRVRCDR